jgi:hypothetical protein
VIDGRIAYVDDIESVALDSPPRSGYRARRNVPSIACLGDWKHVSEPVEVRVPFLSILRCLHELRSRESGPRSFGPMASPELGRTL